ncbi:ExbD/TolR family protein [Sphingobacterium lactis]|uniref:Biopolymer transport protein ExbD n=1 Tax=Sphingobacterium lactis TaxID=797291 RepID=A0A1H5VVS7_9SPHI|nr:biopolymer transporter ExbD [Sphingobacterium lactis]SEF91362.1 Biopolymer transport protein ExbD [Sphingobacterium lactis]
MGKAKVKRASTVIDMTAMCDVSFLLLTFFVLTATARQPETLMVDTPASTTLDKLPDDNLSIITVGDNGKVFFTIKNPNVREMTLKNMSAKYGVAFSEEDYKKFKSLEDFGVPFKQVRALLSLEPAKRTIEVQPGIPVDSTEELSNELYHWVQQARLATVEFNRDRESEDKNFTNPGAMTVAIKADAEEKYAVMNLIIETLRNQKQNKFSFVTGLRQEK